MCTQPKYAVDRLLRSLPGPVSTNVYSLCILLNISETTLSKYRCVPMGDTYSIPSDNLFKLANFFGCQVHDLLTTTQPAHAQKAI